MEINRHSREYNDFTPSNIFQSKKAKKQLKQFYQELLKLINEKKKRNENLINIKKDIFFLIKNIFSDKYQYIYQDNNLQSLEFFIFLLCNQLETQISNMVIGFNTLNFSSSDSELMIKNDKSKDIIPTFLNHFYDFFEEELVMDNDYVINTVIEVNNNINNNNSANLKKEEINNSFLLSIMKIINKLNALSISKNEFSKIFTEGVNEPSSNYYCLHDMGFLLIKIIESLINIELLSLKNNNNRVIDKSLCQFIQISYSNIIPCLSEFFANVILDYNLKNVFKIVKN